MAEPGIESLPLNLDCEKALLCSCIKQAQLLEEPSLEPELFAIPAHRIIFEHLRELFTAGSELDFVLFKDLLARNGQLEDAGGNQYLNELWDFVPTAANWKHYRSILAEFRTRRLGILACSELLKELVDIHLEITPNLTERFSSIQRRLEATLSTDSTLVEMLSQSQTQSYSQPAGSVLLGDSHIVKGNVFVVAGPPGVGKSRALIALAEAGACGYEWFGHSTHCRFRTFILQNENGRARLKHELAQLDPMVENFLRVTVPPPLGLCFSRSEFRRDLSRALAAFQPDLVIIDPWNAVARDDKARDYLESFDLVRSVVGSGDSAPAIGIVAHTRKPIPGERANGRALMNLLAGSYVLSSIPRSIWVLQHATEAVNEERVIATCCKNNDGQLGNRGCYRRFNGQWPLVDDFDWHAWDNPPRDKSSSLESDTIDADDIRAVLQNGKLKRSEAVKALMKLAECEKSVAYRYISPYGKFKKLLSFDYKKRYVWLTK